MSSLARGGRRGSGFFARMVFVTGTRRPRFIVQPPIDPNKRAAAMASLTSIWLRVKGAGKAVAISPAAATKAEPVRFTQMKRFPHQEKAAKARELGCDEIIFYRREDVAARVKELTGGEGVQTVFDSVGKDTFEGSLKSLKRRGVLVGCGTASGPFPPIDAFQMVVQGSVYFTRPAFADYYADPAERAELAKFWFDHLSAGRGITHSERSPLDRRGQPQRIYGMQTWLALPDDLEEMTPTFELQTALPVIEEGGARATVIMGTSDKMVVNDKLAANSLIRPPLAHRRI